MATAAKEPPKEPPAQDPPALDPDVQQPPLSNRSRGGGASLSGGETSSCVHVSVRVRPILPSAQPPACSPVDGALRVRTSAAFRDFAFPSVCGPEVANTDLIERSGWTNLLERVFQGYGATIIAYGQTGSGKTFSMSGRIEQLAARESAEGSSSAEEDATADDDGIIVRSLAQIFEYAKVSGAAVSATYLEVYSELVFDLWAVDETSGGGVGGDVSSTPPTMWSSLPVRYDARNGFHVPGLRERALPSLAVARKLLLRGARNRRVRATRGNRDSSRSHSIFTVHVRVPHAAGGGACPPLLGKAVFVDLAGSERLSAGAESNVMTKETGSINRSLFALSKVISKLGAAAEQQVPSLSQSAASGDAAMHVPYRDSTLTKLLRDSLGGNSLALLLACVSPSSRHTDETLSTLYYATRAMNIRNRPVVRVASGDNLGFQGPKGAAGSAASWLPRGGESPSAVAHAVATATSDMHRELTVLRAENARLRASVEDLTPRSIRASSDEAIIAKNNNTEQAARVDNEQLDAEEAVRRATMMAFGVEEEEQEEEEEEEEREEEQEQEQEQEREEVRMLLSTSMNSDDLRTRLAMAEAEIERLKEAAREERGRFISIAIENESLRTENEELRRRRKEEVEEEEEEEKVLADEEDEGEDDVAAWWEVEAAAAAGGGDDDYAAAAQEEDEWKQEQEEQEEQWKLEQEEQGEWKLEQEDEQEDEEEEEEEEEETLETYVLPAAISAVPVMPVEPRYPPAEISHQTTVVAPPAPTAVATKSPRRQQLVTSRQSSKKTEGAITMSQRAFSLLGL